MSQRTSSHRSPAARRSAPGGALLPSPPVPALPHGPRFPGARAAPPSTVDGPVREAPRERYDFHAHTFLTDGECAATDMWHHAVGLGHRALAVTDHLYSEDPRPMLERLRQEQAAFELEGFATLVGVELSMLPPRRIEEAARAARRAGAQIVIVHGETPVEPVPPGTNLAAVGSNLVDVLAHPGLLTEEEATLARAHDVALELSARRGHALGNGLVAQRALQAGSELVVDSDAHAPEQLVRQELARRIALGAGVPPARVHRVLAETPERLLLRCQKGR